jgi:hypothetical protein
MKFRLAVAVGVATIAVCSTAPSAGASASFVVCGNTARFYILTEPRACLLQWPDPGSWMHPVFLRRISWTGWNSASASGTALAGPAKEPKVGLHAYDLGLQSDGYIGGPMKGPYRPVRIRAFNREQCPPVSGQPVPDFFYTTVRVTFPDGSSRSWYRPNCKITGILP